MFFLGGFAITGGPGPGPTCIILSSCTAMDRLEQQISHVFVKFVTLGVINFIILRNGAGFGSSNGCFGMNSSWFCMVLAQRFKTILKDSRGYMFISNLKFSENKAISKYSLLTLFRISYNYPFRNLSSKVYCFIHFFNWY